MNKKPSANDIHEAVRKHYANAITSNKPCCGSQSSPLAVDEPGKFAELSGYSEADLASVPREAVTFGCGNPLSFVDVQPGQTVLDLGSGAGLDLILAARRVGPTGRVIGLDMTDEMLTACRRNLEQAGIVNGEVRKGMMEQMPVADAEVDWIISNCVINLSPEKEKVFAEAFRVLKPGGRLLVSDIVTIGLPDSLRGDLRAWVGCLAGAVEEDAYLGLMRTAGFIDVRVLDKMVYDSPSLGALTGDNCGCGNRPDSKGTTTLSDYADRVASVRVHARKPV